MPLRAAPFAGPCRACGRCRRGRQPFAAGASLGPYEGSLRVLRARSSSTQAAGAPRPGSRGCCCEDEAVRRLLATSDVLVPVPLHPRRLRERGFNQSALIAEALAHGAGRPFSPEALVRRRDTAPQSGLKSAERRRNVRDAFVVRRRACVVGRVVTLVDDVVTTGATAQACALALARGGCGRGAPADGRSRVRAPGWRTMVAMVAERKGSR